MDIDDVYGRVWIYVEVVVGCGVGSGWRGRGNFKLDVLCFAFLCSAYDNRGFAVGV